MKKIIIVLVALVGIFTVSFVVGTAIYAKDDIYKTQESVKYDEVLDSDTPTIYYYYQNTCHYCNSIKDQLTDFTHIVEETGNLDFKLVDMKNTYNGAAWADSGEKTDVDNVETAKDIRIEGTPTMVYVEDHKLADYAVGDDVFRLLEGVEEKYDIDYQFDESKYGK